MAKRITAKIDEYQDAQGQTKGRYVDVGVVDDESALPDDYVRVKTTISPDNVAILSALKEGVEVPGAHMAKTASSVRIK